MRKLKCSMRRYAAEERSSPQPPAVHSSCWLVPLPYRSGNYARFVALYDGAPRMSPYLMDRMLEEVGLGP